MRVCLNFFTTGKELKFQIECKLFLFLIAHKSFFLVIKWLLFWRSFNQRICLIDGKKLAFQIPHLVLHALLARPDRHGGWLVDTLVHRYYVFEFPSILNISHERYTAE